MDANEIKTAVKEAIIESRGDFYIDPKDHFEDHGWIFGTRKGIRKIRNGSLTAIGMAIIGFIGWALKTWVITQSPTP